MGRVKVAARKLVGSKSLTKQGGQDKAKKKTAPAEGGVKRKIRFKPGTVALREIKRY